MAYKEVTAGDIIDGVVNVIVEIRKGERNKYEFDKETGRLFLDRVNGTTLGYPSDYGYIPDTLCEDGDPLDALLIIDESVPHGTVVPSRPIGVLYFEDDGEMDEKLIVVGSFNDSAPGHFGTDKPCFRVKSNFYGSHINRSPIYFFKLT